MTTDAADTTANDDTSSEQVDKTAIPENEQKLELTPEQQAEAEAQAKEQEQAKESRTQKRRRQRQKRELNDAKEAQHKAEVEAAFQKGRAEGGGKEASSEGNEKPQQDDFDTYGEFNEALMDWKLAKAGAKDEKPLDDKPADTNKPNTESADNYPEEFKTFSDAGAEKYGEDFSDMMEAALNNEYPTSQIMAETMMGEDNGIDMAMHFYDHPDEARRIANLTPRQQVKAMDELGETLKKAAPVHKKSSKAPAPLDTENGAAPANKKLEDMGTTDYIAARMKQKHG